MVQLEQRGWAIISKMVISLIQAKKLKSSDLDMVVAGTKDAVLMVESEAKELSEDIMLGGCYICSSFRCNSCIDVVQKLADEVGKPRWDWIVPEKNSDLDLRLREIASEALTERYQVTVKSERSEKISHSSISL